MHKDYKRNFIRTSFYDPFKLLCFLLFYTAGCSVVLAQPPGKHWEGIAYNQYRNELAVFSGAEFQDNQMFLTDTLWLFNGTWRFVDGNNITRRWAHSLAYHDNLLYTYGGLSLNASHQEEVLNDLLRFDGLWSKVAEGSKLVLPTLHSVKGKLLLAGQSLEDRKNFEVWELASNAFKKQSSTRLDVGNDGVRTLVVEDCFVVIYPYDSGFVFQNVTNGEISVVKDLPKRTKFGITYNHNLVSYFLFGGIDESRNLSNDLWQIREGQPEKLSTQDSPAPRASCSLLPIAKGFILYGGT
ncbi:MAG TPA: hypothetical protein PKM27_15855 [Saprospiraceae bacterium]|nr:hypothetical protein [Saprospiraceae bacterium]HNT22155.1 hypothetical protein [Saprospiraceae bacterium]